MSIQSYRTRVVTVQALQWTGENITAVQTLISPASPLWVVGEKNIGIKIENQGRGHYGLSHELQFAEPGDWIVRYPSGRIGITKTAVFEEYYTPVEPASDEIPAEQVQAGVSLGEAAVAAAGIADPQFVDRQPATELDEQTVSER